MYAARTESMKIDAIISKVQKMSNYTSDAKRLARKHGLDVMNVTWDDCARNKSSSWGPCISDMTLQVNDKRMPVIRQPNYTDKTWDVEIDKVPVVVGNEKLSNSDGPSKLETTSLKDYLMDFHKYMSAPPFNRSLNLLVTNPSAKQKDTHVIMSSQCCFLPIEKSKQTKFNVALYNYQSKPKNPAVLVIVSTSKGTSAQIIEGNTQKLLFNNFGKKADFIGQRLTDNRIERNVSIHGEMTQQEKQDNVIVIIQIPLKQKQQHQPHYCQPYQCSPEPYMQPMAGYGGGFPQGTMNLYSMYDMVPQQQPQMQLECAQNDFISLNSSHRSSKCRKKVPKRRENPNVEAAIIKVSEKTTPVCKCGSALIRKATYAVYPALDGNAAVNCDSCSKRCDVNGYVYTCPKSKNDYRHRNGYDLCESCAENQLKFKELNGVTSIERDVRYPIRVTLQYYKSTDNGAINDEIMSAIAEQLKMSSKQADFVGSLVTEQKKDRPTEWVQDKPKPRPPASEPFDWVKLFGDSNDALIQRCLTELNLHNKYYKVFKDNEMTDDTFLELDKADLKELFPTLMGPRIAIFKWIQQHKQQPKPKPQKPVDWIGGVFA